jgi:prolyl oligopeptidase
MMKHRTGSLAIVAACAATVTLSASCRSSVTAYPEAQKGDVVDQYGATRVPDPYRWMENLDAPQVAAWVAAENKATSDYLGRLPMRDVLKARITQLWDYPKTSIPTLETGKLFYRKNSGLEKQAPLYVRAGLTGAPEQVLDPNTWSEDGSLSLAAFAPAPGAKLLAYTVSEGGADWQTIHVKDLASGKELGDDVKWMRFSGLSWTKDGKGFFYSRYPEPPKGKALQAALSGQTLYYHRAGTPQAQDLRVYERKDLPSWFVSGNVTEDGRYLIVFLAEGSSNNNRLYYADLGDPLRPTVSAAIKPVVEQDGAEYAAFGNQGSLLFVRTDRDAPNRKVIGIDLSNPQPSAWKTLVPEEKQSIESVSHIGGRLVVEYLVDVQSRVRIFDASGRAAGELTLPAAGVITGLSGREDTPTIFYAFTSPLYQTTIFAYEPASGQSSPFEAAKPAIDVSRYETTQLFALSKDGTRVPFFLTARKGLALDGSHPTMLYGYGGFSVSTTPTYRADVPAWLEQGGVWVTASMRGGAEYGEAWHRAGMLEKKQNVFDDFIAVAQHLVTTKYTSPAKLGMMGGSNGGLLVGAVMEQRPDLFAVALPAVGVMDMLRYDKFTGGRAWVTEYGSASNPAQFPALYKYSPLQNIRPGTCYPATLATTADHDDRVVPSHSFKFIAALQASQGCDKPVLIRVETQGSHGYRPTDKRIAELADEWAFAASQMGMDVKPVR